MCLCLIPPKDKDMFLLILEKKTNVSEKHRLVASHMHPDQGLNLKPGYVP